MSTKMTILSIFDRIIFVHELKKKKKYLIHFLVKLNFLNIFNMFFFYLYNMVTRIIVIPQTCWYNGNKFDCGLSISCVLEGGKPVDLCSGGMIWSCCVSRDKVQTSASSSSSSTTSSSSSSSAVASASNSVGTIENASEFFFFFENNIFLHSGIVPNIITDEPE